jgi:hypothetical protein
VISRATNILDNFRYKIDVRTFNGIEIYPQADLIAFIYLNPDHALLFRMDYPNLIKLRAITPTNMEEHLIIRFRK